MQRGNHVCDAGGLPDIMDGDDIFRAEPTHAGANSFAVPILIKKFAHGIVPVVKNGAQYD
jgi:hypothetical protein